MRQCFVFFVLTLFFSCDFASSEKDSKTTKLETIINRPFYELKYPSRWHIDTTDTDYDIDSYFSIEAPVDDGLALFFIFNIPIDEEVYVNNQIEAHLKKVMKNGKVEYFDHWGKFGGHGATITGKLLGVWKGELKIFCHSGDSSSFLTVAQYLDRDKEIVLPGLHLIESTFRLKK